MKKTLVFLTAMGMCLNSVSTPLATASENTDQIENSKKWFKEDTTLPLEPDFYIAVIDITMGKTSWKGRLEAINSSDKYDHTIKIDGRAAFYLKGKIKGKYLLTAQMDTGEESIQDMFKKIGDKDPRRAIKMIDPDQYYPIYGDNSQIKSDIDTQGKFYVRLEWDQTKLMWGNEKIRFADSELARYSNSIYGITLQRQSPWQDSKGEQKYKYQAFFSTPQSAKAHDEFLSTGGSLYYLRHKEVIQDTVQLAVEIRDKNSDRLKSTKILCNGNDYEIDYFQGRILLNKPLSLLAPSDTIISSALQNGDSVILVADYEYYQDGPAFDDNKTSGFQGDWQLNDNLRIGAVYVEEQQDKEKYRLAGQQLRFETLYGWRTKLEYAKSTNIEGQGYFSQDGGLTFSSMPVSAGKKKGQAYKIEQEFDWNKYSKGKKPLVFNGSYIHKQKGFSAYGQTVDDDTREYTANIEYQDKAHQGIIRLKNTTLDKSNQYVATVTTLQWERQQQPDLKTITEIQYQNMTDPSKPIEQDVLAAIKAERIVNHKLTVYSGQQFTLHRQDSTPKNHKSTVGLKTKLGEKYDFGLEGFMGSRGNGGLVSLEHKADNKITLHTQYSSEVDRIDGHVHKASVGSEYQMDKNIKMYTERQTKANNKETSVGNLYGLSLQPTEKQAIDISYTKSRVKNTQSQSGNIYTLRDTATLRYGLTGPVAYAAKLELRKDQGNEEKRQFVSTNKLEYNPNKIWTWFGKYDYSLTQDKKSGKQDALFTETTFGAAYRPLKNDKLNLIGKYTYFQNLSPEQQKGQEQNSEKGHVYSLEAIYQLDAKWDAGIKLAHKESLIQPYNFAQWLKAKANLTIFPLTYRFQRNWEAGLEFRRLSVTTAKDVRTGWLATVTRTIDNHNKIGIGYNFTDFNDDLTQSDYTARGWFVNYVAKW